MASPTRSAQDTRERLILTAERLFAERGIGEVSLREVGAAAGQRNTSAAQYHFGNKDSLIAAILDHRMRVINDRRLRRLATMQAEGRSGELRSLLEACIFPLAGSTSESGGHYARFLSQCFADPHFRTSLDWESATSLRLVWAGIRRCLAHLPESVVQARLRMLEHIVLPTLADHEKIGDVADADNPAPWTIDLIDAAEGMLTAAVTAADRESLP
ncbi:TetR/AcrR family transcriptional regulator [Haloactinomyces albus]|uniref:AcrR family transcriptional regulator n=1 Tax=Haloactinomyces albus TaxID=1352928 RepID=A0AAE3ZI54_9ACTN|nr:TetR family transcriptional regulator [Haloactinomyces albus]MDR7304100.1 AcrR family transcriptional regulator [Haloactinomyces albus]